MRILFSLMLAFTFMTTYAYPADIDVVNDSKAVRQSQEDVVTGVVTDANGEPLIGATVQQKGTENKSITDIDGHYTLRLKSGKSRILVVSYVGMKPQTIHVTGNLINATLQEDANQLQDVVVVGAYGTAQRRSDLVGSAYQVNSSQLKGLPQQRVDVLLDGLIPGVKISPNTEDPGSPCAWRGLFECIQ